MSEVENVTHLSLQSGLERLREFLRWLRHSDDEAEEQRLLAKCADVLCQLASLTGSEKESQLPALLSRMGLGLVREARLSLWAKLLGRFTHEASARRDLVAMQASAATVDIAASPASLEAIFQRFQEPEPPRVDALVELLRVLPATSLSMATRLAIRSVPEFLLEPVKDFCRLASEHHENGLVELAADPDAAVARFALAVVAESVDARALRIAAEALRHADPEVRIAAIACLGRQSNDASTRQLFDRLDRRFIRPLTEAEEIALYDALFFTGRLDALARIEARLIGPPRSLVARLKALVNVASHDPVVSTLIRHLAENPSPKAQDLLQRGTHAANASVARACREALQTRA
jgi:HEAT repeat protein